MHIILQDLSHDSGDVEFASRALKQNIEYLICLSRELKLPYKLSKVPSNPHWMSAAARQLATAVCLKIAKRYGDRIIDVFGSPRTPKIAQHLNINNVEYTRKMITPIDYEFEEVNLTLKRAVLMFVDVYDLTELEVRTMMVDNKNEVSMFVLLSCGSGGANSYVSFRRKGELSISRSVTGDISYKNSYPDWLYEPMYGSVVPKRTVGPFHIIEYRLTPSVKAQFPLPLCNQVKTDYEVALRYKFLSYFSQLSFLDKITFLWYKKKIQYWEPAINFHYNSFGTLSKYALTTFESTLQNRLMDDKDYVAYVTAFPDEHIPLLRGTMQFIMNSRTEEMIPTMSHSLAKVRRTHEKLTQVLENDNQSFLCVFFSFFALLFYGCITLIISLCTTSKNWILRRRQSAFDIDKWINGCRYGPSAFPTLADHFKKLNQFCLPLPHDCFVPSTDYNGQVQDFPEMEKVQYIPDLPESTEMIRQGIYPIFVPLVTLSRPASTYRNLITCIRFRLTKSPKYLVEAIPKLYREVYFHVPLHRNTVDYDHIGFPWPNELETPIKRCRVKAVFAELDSFVNDKVDTCCIHLKGDETIPLKESGGNYLMVPRAIIDVPPKINHILQCLAHDIKERFESLCVHDGHLNILEGKRRFKSSKSSNSGRKPAGNMRFHYCMYYVNHFNSQIMSEFYSAAINLLQSHQIEFFVMVAGDDSVVLRLVDGVVVAIEGDYSMYDQTQRLPLQLYLKRYLVKFLGIVPDDLSIWWQLLNQQNFKVKPKNSDKFIFKREIQQLTGIATTSVFNSILNAIVTVAIHSTIMDLSGLDEIYSSFGLTIKSEIKCIDDGVTFLKGWFIPTHDARQFVWGPLPSQIFKMGKILNNPAMVSGLPRGTLRIESLRTVAFSLAKSLGDISVEYPILGAFLDKLIEFSNKRDLPINPENIEYKMRVKSNLSNLRPQVERLILIRYGLTHAEVALLEARISSCILPCVLYHNSLWKLLIDYYPNVLGIV